MHVSDPELQEQLMVPFMLLPVSEWSTGTDEIAAFRRWWRLCGLLVIDENQKDAESVLGAIEGAFAAIAPEDRTNPRYSRLVVGGMYPWTHGAPKATGCGGASREILRVGPGSPEIRSIACTGVIHARPGTTERLLEALACVVGTVGDVEIHVRDPYVWIEGRPRTITDLHTLLDAVTSHSPQRLRVRVDSCSTTTAQTCTLCDGMKMRYAGVTHRNAKPVQSQRREQGAFHDRYIAIRRVRTGAAASADWGGPIVMLSNSLGNLIANEYKDYVTLARVRDYAPLSVNSLDECSPRSPTTWARS